jgi:hypothetical protein
MSKLTIFGDNNYGKEIQSAVKNLISGKTPISEVRKRDSRGGEVNYVNGYYMFRQASLITGFRWSSKCLREKYIPSEDNPTEIGALMEVTLYDNDKAYSHQSWGSSDVKRYAKDQFKDGKKVHFAGEIISLFDDLKSAYTDGNKKCLSYFGIANDIYGGRELNYFEDQEDIEADKNPGVIVTNNTDMRTALDAYIKNKHVRYDIALSLIGVKSMNDITDYRAAYQKIKEYVEGGRK